MASANKVFVALNNWLNEALSSEQVVQIGPIKYDDRGKVQTLGDYWAPPCVQLTENSLEEYCYSVFKRQFHIVFKDYALLSVYAQWDNSKLVSSRFYYQPCPVLLREEEWQTLLNGEELEPLHSSRIMCKSALRFEFDPTAATAKHPASHLHLNDPSVRIGLDRALNFHSAFDALLNFFYPELLGVAGNFLGQTATNEPDADPGIGNIYFRVLNPKKDK